MRTGLPGKAGAAVVEALEAAAAAKVEDSASAPSAKVAPRARRVEEKRESMERGGGSIGRQRRLRGTAGRSGQFRMGGSVQKVGWGLLIARSCRSSQSVPSLTAILRQLWHSNVPEAPEHRILAFV